MGLVILYTWGVRHSGLVVQFEISLFISHFLTATLYITVCEIEKCLRSYFLYSAIGACIGIEFQNIAKKSYKNS